jgi:hypothetical protein
MLQSATETVAPNVSLLQPATTEHALVLVLGVSERQMRNAGITMTELAELLHEFACDVVTGADPVAAVVSSGQDSQRANVVRQALRVAERLSTTSHEESA